MAISTASTARSRRRSRASRTRDVNKSTCYNSYLSKVLFQIVGVQIDVHAVGHFCHDQRSGNRLGSRDRGTSTTTHTRVRTHTHTRLSLRARARYIHTHAHTRASVLSARRTAVAGLSVVYKPGTTTMLVDR